MSKNKRRAIHIAFDHPASSTWQVQIEKLQNRLMFGQNTPEQAIDLMEKLARVYEARQLHLN